jgi:hypothetical protein
VSGVQHVDCVTFCTSFFIKGVIREREREEKQREREGKCERERDDKEEEKGT